MNLKEPFLLVNDTPTTSTNSRFILCLGIGITLGIVSFLLFPFSIAAFGALYSIASIIIMGSTLFVASFKQQIDNLKDRNRAWCFGIYLTTIGLTLFFAFYPGIWFRSLFVFLSVIIQCFALGWYCLSYFPKVQAGIRAATMYFF